MQKSLAFVEWWIIIFSLSVFLLLLLFFLPPLFDNFFYHSFFLFISLSFSTDSLNRITWLRQGKNRKIVSSACRSGLNKIPEAEQLFSLFLSLVSRFLGFFVGLRKGSRRGCRDYCYVSMSGDIRNILPTHLCLGRRPAGFLISHANCPDVPRNREEISVIISRTEAASSLPPEIGSISCLGEFEYTRGYVSVSARSKLQGLWKQPLENWPNWFMPFLYRRASLGWNRHCGPIRVIFPSYSPSQIGLT